MSSLAKALRLAAGGVAATVGVVFLQHWLFVRRRSPTEHIVGGWIPFVGCGLEFIRNPTSFFQQQRLRCGDTFTVYLFGVTMVCTFSPEGLTALYRVRERDASFTEATKGLLGLKLPKELLGDPNLAKFHRGLQKRLMATYIEHAQLAAQQWTDDLLCGEGSFDIFPTMKALVHNIGFRCWVGPEATRKNYMPRLIAAYEELDPEAGFQDLTRLTATLALGKLKEKAALDELESILTEIWEAKTRSLGRDPLQCPELNGEAAEDPDNLTALHRLHAHRSEADRRRQVAIDVFHFHLASQANMYAALSWTLANLLTQSGGHLEAVLVEMDHARATFGPEYRGSTGALDGMLRLEAVIQESLRLAQQSITLRKVLRPVSFSYEGGTLRLDPGMYIATLLSVTNKCNRHVPNHPPLAEFFPERYTLSSSNRSGGVELDPEIYPEAVHVHLSTFGRGFHACPGQRFAMYIMKIAITKLLETCELTPQFEAPEIPSASVGAIARAVNPCIVSVRPRATL